MEGVVNFSPRPASHRAHGRGRSKLHLILRATAPMGGGDDVLSKLLLVLRVDGTHQKYSSVESLTSKVGPTWFASLFNITRQVAICLFTRGRRSSLHQVDNQYTCQITMWAAFFVQK